MPTAWTAFDKRPMPAKISMKTNPWPAGVRSESEGHEWGVVQVTGPPVLLPAASLQRGGFLPPLRAFFFGPPVFGWTVSSFVDPS